MLRDKARRIGLTVLLAMVAVTLCSCDTTKQWIRSGPAKTEMSRSAKPFGTTPDGQAVRLYTLRNTQGMTAEIMTYGAIVVSLTAPDKDGSFNDIVLGYDNLADYIKVSPYFGAIVGRYGNRIGKGKFTLDGIPPAPRGVPQIEVTFDINANGILEVTAKDKATSRQQNITITASSGLSESEVESMRRDAEAHAEEDRKRRELIEARNTADNAVYSSEKTLTDLGEKVPADIKTRVEEAIAKVRSVRDQEDPAVINSAVEELMKVLQEVGQAAYSQTQSEAPEQPQPDQDQPSKDDGEVVDGEFHHED